MAAYPGAPEAGEQSTDRNAKPVIGVTRGTYVVWESIGSSSLTSQSVNSFPAEASAGFCYEIDLSGQPASSVSFINVASGLDIGSEIKFTDQGSATSDRVARIQLPGLEYIDAMQVPGYLDLKNASHSITIRKNTADTWAIQSESSSGAASQPQTLSVQVTATDIYVRSPHSTTHDKVEMHKLPTTPTNSSNGQSDFEPVRLVPVADTSGPLAAYNTAGTIANLASVPDDTAPIKLNNMFLAGSHGIHGRQVGATGHGKAQADVGSVWSDTASKEWVLIEVVDTDTLKFGARNTGSSDVWTINGNISGATLTHVSGATNTADVTVGSNGFTQLYPVTRSSGYSLTVDGNAVGAGIYNNVSEVKLTDNRELINAASAFEYLVANPGTTELLNNSNVETQVTHNMTRTWQPDGQVVDDHTYTADQGFLRNYIGGVQAGPIGWSDELYWHVPNLNGPVNGQDFHQLPVDAGMTASIFADTTWADANNPPNRMVQISQDTPGVLENGFAIGTDVLSLSSVPATRASESNASGDINSSRKGYLYTRGLDGVILASGTKYDFRTYRVHFPVLSQDAFVEYHYVNGGLEGDTVAVYAFNASGTADYSAGKFTGKQVIEVLESSNATLNTSGEVPGSGLNITTTGNSFIVVRLR